jgi:hypothetical protein
MTKQIDHITIYVKDKGFLLSMTPSKIDGKYQPGEEYAYSNLDDLQVGLANLLDPQAPTFHVDCPRDDDLTMTAMIHRNADGIVETVVIDDGWRVWDGGKYAKEYPPGVEYDSTVEVKFRNAPNFTGRADSLIWSHHFRRDADIVAYRVVES